MSLRLGWMVGLAVLFGVTAHAEVLHRHHDCVGPGFAGLAGEHDAHTAVVSGFSPTADVTYAVDGLGVAAAEAGSLCPTVVPAPVEMQDFTGRYILTVRCGSLASSPLVLEWWVDFAAGLVVKDDLKMNNTCSSSSRLIQGQIFPLTLEIPDFPFTPSPATGGVLLTVSQ